MGGNLKGALLALAAFGLYSSHDVIVKLMGVGYSPFQLIFFSVLFSFPIAILIMMRDARPGTLLPVHPWWIALRTLAALMTGITAFYAFKVLPLADVYAIIFASPLLITILAIPILGEKVRIRRWIAVLVGLVGVIIVLDPSGEELTLGHLAALAAASGGAVASVIARKIGPEERSVVLLLYPMMANFIVMAIALPWVYEPPELSHLGFFAAMAILGSTGGLLIIAAYKAGEAVIVAPMQYSQILWATLFGALIFGELPGMQTVAGAAIIISSGLYIVLRESRAGTSRNRPVLQSRLRPETGTIPRKPNLMGLAGRSGMGPQRR
jgi:drug/metabolite transporter (DMT)-like permease